MIKEYSVQVESQKKACLDLDQWVTQYRSYAAKGQSASYIPALEKINLSQLGICIVEPNGTMIKSGDWEVPFTLQSISKVIG
ncbi:glutaminase, partial [Bacillus sp. TL12]|uniref:glutaminase n=1 Tax=Bacillus sp. TL12 TaxID=2894756 RepID=UPI001F52466A